MSLHPLIGHQAIRERLRRAAAAGRLPQSMLLHGPAGIGKQRLGLWLASLLLCESGDACGACRHCRLAARLEHPDLHWYFPVARPTRGVGSAAKLREALEEVRLEELARRREEPLQLADTDAPRGIYLEAVQRMRERAATRPALARRAVFVIGEAESMVPQVGSPAAANAFLKLLEEPPLDTFFILTSRRPDSLLPTIRSRVLSIRVAPLSDQEVEQFLTDVAGMEASVANRLARVSHGSVGRALGLRDTAGEGTQDRADALVRAALGSRRDRLRFVLTLPPARARGEFSLLLDAAERRLRDMAAIVLGREGEATDTAGARSLLEKGSVDAETLARAAEHLHEARLAADGNVNPQAIASVLLMDLAQTLESG